MRNVTLAEVAERYALGRYLVLGRGVEEQDGRNRPSLLGALAGGADRRALRRRRATRPARRLILGALARELEAVAIGGLERDPKSLLQQACQAHWHATPSYRTVRESGPPHAREFLVEVRLGGEIFGSGEGRSKQAAERSAAEAALQRLPEGALP